MNNELERETLCLLVLLKPLDYQMPKRNLDKLCFKLALVNQITSHYKIEHAT